MSQTVLEVLDRTASAYPERPALRWKHDGAWQTANWTEYRDLVRLVARGLISLGIEAGQGVAIMGYNRPEWFGADLGAIAAGGVPAGIYTTCTADQCEYIIDHCAAPIVVAENASYLPRLLEVRDRVPGLKSIVLMEGGSDEPGVLAWSELLDRGEAVSEADLDERIVAQRPEDVCTLIYTSGTTGSPKAVMISHHNAVWTARALADTFDLGPEESVISYLPLSHIAEQIVSLHAPLACGICTSFAEGLEQLGDNLRDVRPTFFFAVPRVWEKIQARMQAVGAQAPPLRRKIAAWARRVGLEAARARQDGRRAGAGFALADRLVYSKVRERLGLDRARIMATSAAPISLDTLEFFWSLGMPIYEVYGMSECTGPATVSVPERFHIGKAGFAMEGTELSIAEDGEILIRGPHVTPGYFKNPEATAETIDDDGWLHSGDVGQIDARGLLSVTDRKKELIITSGGKNVGPQILENRFKEIPLVAQAVVIGDRRKYLSALFTLDPERLSADAQAVGSEARTLEAAASCPLLRAHLENAVTAINDSLASYETIKRFAILPRELTIEHGELTPTMKLKRRVIHSNWSDTIERLYPGAPPA